ncbi:PDZ domain-containing protein [Mucilaginibacter daejeonensis]|uniref:M61 family metallopeptidase n=1 Tax=Mucilaginibacter daejeonensis TaxID=398049 RepID=UPI001D179659|nr:PDZ domain-containing protein [Mucilaginibacter daejeonensis]UEG53323.1 PDZ domain-containing protein [Mucilaginibacter daejeonensis]
MKNIYSTAAALLLAATAFAQNEITYTVSFPNAIHHEAEISMRVPQVPAGTMRFRMSRSSPGRYATHEFGKNIYNVKAYGEGNKPLVLKQVEGDVYEVAQHGATVIVNYTLFGNYMDGTYVGIDASTAHFNMPAAFMWVLGMDKRPARFKFNDLDKFGWKVATQLKPEAGGTYYARDLQYMMDSPTSLANYKTYSWDITNPGGKKQAIHLTSHSDDDQATIDAFGQMVKKVTLEAQAVFGELPNYDYGNYVFLHDVAASNAGDGMEHRNSTSIVQTTPKIAGFETRLLGTFSHEYFHSWNVERIRPKTLEPFNFEHANMSNELWFAEGFTQYYGGLLLERAGLLSAADHYRTTAGLINSVLNSPAALKYSPIQMSRYAVFADAGVSIDPNNNANVFSSYYTYGGATALALDLRLRSQFKLTLDGYMRAVWAAHGKPEKPYTVADLQNVLASYTKDPAFAADFFKRYIYGSEKNDYAALLANFGLLLRKAQPGKAWAGQLGTVAGRGRSGQARSGESGGLTITNSLAMNSPMYKAGLDAGDVIMTVNGTAIADAQALTDLLATKRPGDKVPVTYKNRTGDHEATITLEENPTLEVVEYEAADKQPTAAQKQLRTQWLSSQIK